MAEPPGATTRNVDLAVAIPRTVSRGAVGTRPRNDPASGRAAHGRPRPGDVLVTGAPGNVRRLGEHQPVVGARVYVDPTAVVIGDVVLGDDVSLWPMAVVRGDVNAIRIGERSNIQDGCVLHVAHEGPYGPGAALQIGADVTVGHKAVLHACTVGERCLIGINAVVMDRVVIEDEVLLAACSLVTPGKRLRGGWLYAGQPARPVRELAAEERAMLHYSAEHYVRVKDRYLS